MPTRNAESPFVERRISPVDIHVGSRIRQGRVLLGMSQEDLGVALGLTFQQIQKYEMGYNRVGASRLFEISRVLQVDIPYFFDGLTEDSPEIPVSGRRGRFSEERVTLEPIRDSTGDAFMKRETLEMIRAYYGIVDPEVRRHVADLMRSIASGE